MKKLALFILFLAGFFAPPAKAQTTLVTANVLDPTGKPYAGCQVNISFVPSPSATTVPTINGSTFQTTIPVVQCDSFGNFSATLIDNALISDGHTGSQTSQWAFFIRSADVCFAGNKVGFNVSLTITGASQNITTNLQTAAAPLPTCGGGGGGGNPISLQTNGVPNATQTIENLISGAGVTLTPDLAGGTTITSTAGNILPTDNTFTSNNRFKGPIPWFDVTAFGARPVTYPAFSTTASCNGTTTISLTVASSFQNGDGITIYGCGTTNALSTPGTPTVTPGIASTLTVPDAQLVSATGSSTYSYKIFAIDKNGGTTVAGSPRAIVNGAAALGMSGPITVTSASLSGGTLTLTLPGTNSLAAGMLIHFWKSTNAILSGDYTISSVAGGGTSIVINNTSITSTGAPVTSTGGNINWAIGNQLTWTGVAGAWEYGICAQRPGDSSYSLIGLSFPSGAANYTSSTTFTDWGPTITSIPKLPPYLTNANCSAGAATNDYLSTTIVSGAGTTSLTVANTASQTISGQTAVFDDAPAFLAAATAASAVNGSVIFIPVTTGSPVYTINSRLDMTSFGPTISVNQEGIIYAQETVATRAHWYGTDGATSLNQFQAASTPVVGCVGAWPCFYDPDEVPFWDHLTFNELDSNQALVLLFDGHNGPTQGGHISRINCDSGATLDFSGMCIVVRPGTYNFNMDDISTVSGPGNGATFIDTTWTPSIYFSGDAARTPFSVLDWHLRDIQTSGRTVYASDNCGTGQNNEFTHYYSQGGLMPMLTMQNFCGSIVGINLRATEFVNDTSPTASLSVLGSVSAAVLLNNMYTPSAETAGIPGFVTGRNLLNAGTFINTPAPPAGTTYADTNSFLPTGIVSAAYNGGTFTGTSFAGGTYTGASYTCPEGSPPAGSAGFDLLYCDSGAHQFKVINNGGPPTVLGTIGGSIANTQVAVGSGTNTLSGSNSLTFISNVLNAPAMSTGSGCTPAGATATGGACFTEATSTGWTPTAGFDYIRGDTTHSLLASLNGGTEKILPPITGATTIGDCVQFAAGPTLADAGSSCGGGSGGANVALSNLAGVGINTTLLPGTINTVALGSNALSFTNLFVGTVANQTGSFNTANLTANRVINWPDATSTPVRDCPLLSNQFLTAIAVATGTCTQAQPSMANISAGTAPAGLFDFSGANIKVRNVVSFVATANNNIGIDTTTGAMHLWVAAGDSVNAAFASAPAGSKCVQTSGTVGLVTEAAAVCGTTTPSTTDTFTNKTYNAESTGNALSEPVKFKFPAATCNNTTSGNGWNIGVTNAPTPQCVGTTVRKAVLQFARGNVAYLPTFELTSDWNASASTDIRICFTTTDTTNGHITSFNIQTGFNKVDGTVTDDPSLNALQALSVTTGASQTSGGELCGSLTAMTMTGSAAGYNMEVAITRNNSGTDTNTDTAVAVKSAEITLGVTKNAANR